MIASGITHSNCRPKRILDCNFCCCWASAQDGVNAGRLWQWMHSWCKIQKQGLRHPWKGMVMSHELNLLSLWSLLVRFFFSWLFLIWSMHHRSSTRLLGAKRLTQKNTYVYVYIYMYIYYPEGNPKLDPPRKLVPFLSWFSFLFQFVCGAVSVFDGQVYSPGGPMWPLPNQHSAWN